MVRYRKVRVAASAGVLLAGMWGTSLAVFTDSATSDASFTSGDVDLAAAPATALFEVQDMAPGDVEFAGLTVTNDGSLDLRYAMSATPSGTLADVLETAVWTGGTCDAAGYAGATALDSGTLTSGIGFGSSAAGAQAGDRSLAPAASETLCFRVELPIGTGNTYQATSASATFTFDAEQTANNP